MHSQEYQLLVGLLRRHRLQANLTQAELAGRLDRRPQSFVSKYEAGEQRLDVIELRAICLALGTDLPKFVRKYERELANLSGERPV